MLCVRKFDTLPLQHPDDALPLDLVAGEDNVPGAARIFQSARFDKVAQARDALRLKDLFAVRF
jgi:hypothetical protein